MRTIWASRRRTSTASAWPCGAHTIVERSLTTSGSTIASSLARRRSPISSSTRSRPTGISPGRAGSPGPDVGPLLLVALHEHLAQGGLDLPRRGVALAPDVFHGAYSPRHLRGAI